MAIPRARCSNPVGSGKGVLPARGVAGTGGGCPCFGTSAQPPKQRLSVVFKIQYAVNVAVTKYASRNGARAHVFVLSAARGVVLSPWELRA